MTALHIFFLFASTYLKKFLYLTLVHIKSNYQEKLKDATTNYQTYLEL